MNCSEYLGSTMLAVKTTWYLSSVKCFLRYWQAMEWTVKQWNCLRGFSQHVWTCKMHRISGPHLSGLDMQCILQVQICLQLLTYWDKHSRFLVAVGCDQVDWVIIQKIHAPNQINIFSQLDLVDSFHVYIYRVQCIFHSNSQWCDDALKLFDLATRSLAQLCYDNISNMAEDMTVIVSW